MNVTGLSGRSVKAIVRLMDRYRSEGEGICFHFESRSFDADWSSVSLQDAAY